MANETFDSAMTRNVRDKLIILAITWIASLGLIIVAVFAWAQKFTEALAVLSAVSSATGLLGTAYKGNPSPDPASPTATGQSTTETTTKETVSDQEVHDGRQKEEG